MFFLEEADNEFKTIREHHIRKRDSLIVHGGDPAMAIWYVYQDLEKKDSLTVAEFSQLLKPMNDNLIKTGCNFMDRFLEHGNDVELR